MNMSDMYTRQIVNQIYIAQLYRNAEKYRLLRDSRVPGTLVSAGTKRKLMLIAMLGSVVIATLASS